VNWSRDVPSLHRRLVDDFPTAFTWVATCSPKNSTVEQLALATMDLHLWFLYLDDYSSEDYSGFYDSLYGMIQSDVLMFRAESRPIYPVFELFASHVKLLAEHSNSLARYLGERRKALIIYKRRNRECKTGWNPSFEGLLRLREVTTLFRLWYTLWEILGGFQIADEDYASPEFRQAIDATTRWHVFINDLHSLPRDDRENMPNLVHCLKRDRDWENAEAIEFLRMSCVELEAQVTRIAQATQAHTPERVELRTAFAFLSLNIEGGKELYQRGLARYEVPPEQ
jgi:Terpene synthase family 2, C-terminal metal binding